MIQSQIKSTLYTWLKRVLGTRQIFTLTFDADFVTGNVISATFGATSFTLNFDTSHAVTLETLRRFIQTTPEISSAQITGARQITCTVYTPGTNLTVTVPTVTGGATQAVCTRTQTQAPVDTTVVFAEQLSALKPPAYPFATIRLASFVGNGWDEYRSFDQQTGLVNMGGQRQCTVEINYFGTDSMTAMSDIFNSLSWPSMIDFFSQNGCAIGVKNSIQNLTAMLESKYEERAFFDFTLLYADNYTHDFEVIEKAEIEGEVDGGATGSRQIGPWIVEV